MKKCINTLALFGLLALLGSCSSKPEGPVSINLEKAQKSQDLKFSQLADNIRCIPLESGDDILIPDDQTRIWAGENYIITLNNQDIRLFSSDGKHLRKLASEGKGPEEYQYLLAFTANEKDKILYYSQQRDREHIFGIRLEDGSKFTIPFKKMVLQMQMQGDNLICIPVTSRRGDAQQMFVLSPQGQLLDSIYCSAPVTSGTFSISMPRIFPAHEKDIYIQNNDTLYQVAFPTLKPLAYFDYSNKFNTESNPNGDSQSGVLKTSDYYIVQSQHNEFLKSENAIRMTIRNGQPYLIDAKSFEPTKIEKFYIDPLGLTLDDFPRLTLSGNKIVMKISAFEIKEAFREKEETGEPITPLLKQLNEQIHEEDNPVLIVGDLK